MSTPNKLIAALEELEASFDCASFHNASLEQGTAIEALAKLIRSGEECRRSQPAKFGGAHEFGFTHKEAWNPTTRHRYHVIYLGEVKPEIVVEERHREMARVAVEGTGSPITFHHGQLESAALALATHEAMKAGEGRDDD